MAPATDRQPYFKAGLLLSVLLHLFAWRALVWQRDAAFRSANDPLEIDLTRPFRLTTNPLLAHRAVISGTGAPKVDAPRPTATPVGGAKEPVKDWVLPGSQTKELEKPSTIEHTTPVGPGTAEGGGLGGLGTGEGDGEVDWVYLTDLPRMLNRDDLARNLRRFYPEAERRAGREGSVRLNIHINREGRVTGVDVVGSAGAAFDEAALKVIREARFSPAKVGEKAVPVKIQQTIAFQLSE